MNENDRDPLRSHPSVLNPFAAPASVDSNRREGTPQEPSRGIAFLRYWLVMCLSIAFSGGIYGIIVAMSVLSVNRQNPPLTADIGLVFIGGAVGGIVAGFVAGPIVMLACLVYFLMQTSRRAPIAPAVRLFADTFCGASCGAISILSFTGDTGLANQDNLILVGAMVMGGLGGAFASIMLSLHHRRQIIHSR